MYRLYSRILRCSLDCCTFFIHLTMSHFCFVRHFFGLILVMKTCPLSILPNKCSYQINVGFKAAAFQFNLTQVHHHEQEVCCLNKSCFSSFCNEYVAAKKASVFFLPSRNCDARNLELKSSFM